VAKWVGTSLISSYSCKVLLVLRLSETGVCRVYQAQLFLELLLPAFLAFFLQFFKQAFFRGFDFLQEGFPHFVALGHASAGFVKATIQLFHYFFTVHEASINLQPRSRQGNISYKCTIVAELVHK
jgi:hypothetical protein